MQVLTRLERFRMVNAHARSFFHGGGVGDASSGIFELPSLAAVRRHLAGQSLTRQPPKLYLVIATIEGGWDHVSVSREDRCPTWEEMDAIKRLFFRDDEVVVQLHVPPAEHINLHPRCLRLWRPQGFDLPLPDPAMVGTPASRNWPWRSAA